MSLLTGASYANKFALKMNDILTDFIFYSCVFGVSSLILGNILNIIICLRKKLRQEIMSFYNIIISTWNILIFVCGLFFYFPPSIHMQDVLLISDFLCASLNFSLRVCVQMSAWLHVFLSIDRYLCVAFNQKLAFILNDRKKLSFIFMGLFAFICVINVPNLFFTLSNTNSTFPMPKAQCGSTPLINQIRNTVISIFRIILPLVLQITFSVLLIYKFFKVRRSVLMNKSMEKEYRFARIILWLNLMFIITETPFLLATLYFSVVAQIPTYPLDVNSSNALALMTVVYYVALVFSMYLFGSIFFVNLFTNKVFQREILVIFGFTSKPNV
jgi:hypothetical protein